MRSWSPFCHDQQFASAQPAAVCHRHEDFGTHPRRAVIERLGYCWYYVWMHPPTAVAAPAKTQKTWRTIPGRLLCLHLRHFLLMASAAAAACAGAFFLLLGHTHACCHLCYQYATSTMQYLLCAARGEQEARQEERGYGSMYVWEDCLAHLGGLRQQQVQFVKT